MTERYLVAAGRIRSELKELEQVVYRAKRAMELARMRPDEQDIFLDSVALNLHDFYTGVERIFRNIASLVDRSLPEGADWHRELLKQMQTELPKIRPAVLSASTGMALDEYLRFRHVVRNIYAFQFDKERLGKLVGELSSCFKGLSEELLAFMDFLEKIGFA